MQAIEKRMKQLKLIKSKINKYNFEIIKNIELIFFLQTTYIKSYIIFLKDKLTKEKEKELLYIIFFNSKKINFNGLNYLFKI